jgi:hypothetical protein
MQNMDTQISHSEASAETTEAKQPFIIDSPEAAEWVLELFARNREERARKEAQMLRRLEELDADYNSLLGKFGPQLEAWGKEEAARRRRKTVTLDNGTITFRHQDARLEIDSPSDAMTTARLVCPAAFVSETKTVEKFDKAAFLAYAQERLNTEGELIPGIKRVPEGDAFSIKIGAAKLKKGKALEQEEGEEE